MTTLDPFWYVTIVTLIAGAGGTGLGGLVGALLKSESNKVISLLLSLAGGIMTAMVCFELLAESVDAAQESSSWGVMVTILAVMAGVLVVYVLNVFIDRRTHDQVPHVANPDHPKTHDDIDELIHADHWVEHKRNNASCGHLVVAGIVMACAIALHNIPEGMTIGASFAISDDLLLGTGMVMAVLIGLHNIPEGMAVSVPLVSGGMGRVRATIYTTLCGMPTVLGAWLGLWLGDIGPIGLSLSLGFAGGAMLYVVFGEILPQSVLMYRSKAPAFAVIAGMLIGMFIIYF